MNRSWKYFFFLLWLSYLFICGVLLFTRGFLLTRRSLLFKSSCVDDLDCSGYKKISQEDPSPLNTQLYLDCLDGDQLKLRKTGHMSRCSRSEKKIILILIDALRYDFAKYDPHVKEDELLPFQNRLKIIDELLNTVPNNTLLLKFIANPPTTTMQRLKGLTTGSLPTFIDIGSNFAASEIDEDNILDQLVSLKKNIVFMGDDTWTSLYPKRFIRQYPFPSFNVWDLDTVDSGILTHLKPEIGKKDWDLLIAHFLGVDHCGHRYGPYHPEMIRKLTEMNDVIRDISNTIDDDTILIVLGDHGMTPGGDHGGESIEEVTSALFIYSPVPLLSSKMALKTDTVYQVDIVPTISAILGFPIPFSNLGKVILEALPIPQLEDVNEEDVSSNEVSYALNILQNNIEQAMLYINTYSRQIQVFSKEKISTLSKKFYAIKKKSDSVNDTDSFKIFYNDSIDFLNYLREMCESVWVQFDSFSMSRGLVLTFLLISFTFFIVEGIPFDHFTSVLEGMFLWIAYGIIIFCACTSAVLQYYKIVDDIFLFTYVSTLTVSIITMAKVVVQYWVEITNLWHITSRNREWLDVLPRFIHLCSILILFSNSFIVEEGTVLFFLLNAMVWFIVFNKFTLRPEFYNVKNKAVEKFYYARKIFFHPKTRQIILATAFSLLLRVSHHYWRCREEQRWCLKAAESNDYFLTIKAGNSNFGSLMTIVLLALFISLVRLWLKSCGNLVGFAPMVVLVRYAPNVVVVCIGGFWILQGLPLETRSKLFVPWQLQILPWTVFTVTAVALLCLFINPLSVYVLEKKTDIFSVYGHSNIIPQLFYQMRNFIKNTDTTDKESMKNNSPMVYGLGTVYSSAFVMLGEFISLLIILLLGDILASSVILMIAVSTILLVIVAVCRLENTLLNAQLFHVSWSYVLSWGLLSSYFFYGTGHQPTFPSIHWNTAFIGSGGPFKSNILPSILIGLNTFCSQIINGLTLPLLFVLPFTLHVMFPKFFSYNSQSGEIRQAQDKSSIKQGDLYLYEKNNLAQYAIFKLCSKYLLYHSTRMFSCMLAAAIHCRHLMVWMIFAPRFIFEGFAFFVTMGSVLLGHLLIIRITTKVDELVQELLKKRS